MYLLCRTIVLSSVLYAQDLNNQTQSLSCLHTGMAYRLDRDSDLGYQRVLCTVLEISALSESSLNTQLHRSLQKLLSFYAAGTTLLHPLF